MPPVVVNIELYGVVRDIVRDTQGGAPSWTTAKASRSGTSWRAWLQSYGPALQDRLFDRYGPSSFVKVFAGGRLVTDLDQPLPDTDGKAIRIIVFAAAGGG